MSIIDKLKLNKYNNLAVLNQPSDYAVFKKDIYFSFILKKVINGMIHTFIGMIFPVMKVGEDGHVEDSEVKFAASFQLSSRKPVRNENCKWSIFYHMVINLLICLDKRRSKKVPAPGYFCLVGQEPFLESKEYLTH